MGIIGYWVRFSESCRNANLLTYSRESSLFALLPYLRNERFFVGILSVQAHFLLSCWNWHNFGNGWCLERMSLFLVHQNCFAFHSRTVERMKNRRWLASNPNKTWYNFGINQKQLQLSVSHHISSENVRKSWFQRKLVKDS